MGLPADGHPVRVAAVSLAEGFIQDGYVRIKGAFPQEVAHACREALWAQIACSPTEPGTWTTPVIRLGYQEGGPFEQAVNTPVLHAAFDSLVGVDRWLPRTDMGTFVVRFPSNLPSGDDGWHIDASFPPADPDQREDPFQWRVNVNSRGRALLMLFLFTDVTEADAPTRLRVGSHTDVARILAPHGDPGLTVLAASEAAASGTADHPVACATGNTGDVYLCHPFLLHAAQAHHGTAPRILAQPPLHPRGWINTSFDPVAGTSPLELAIKVALRTTA
jgi:hypothetical protein